MVLRAQSEIWALTTAEIFSGKSGNVPSRSGNVLGGETMFPGAQTHISVLTTAKMFDFHTHFRILVILDDNNE